MNLHDLMNIPTNIHDWHTLLLLGSIGLLAAAAVLKTAGKSGPVPPLLKTASKSGPVPPPDLSNSIGRYRPQVYH